MELDMHTIIHGVLALFLVIELGLTAYCVSLLDNWPGSAPSSVYFMLFNTIWSILVLAYVAAAPIYAVGIFSGIAPTVLEGITSLFWFSGSLAMAVWVRGGAAAGAVAFGFMILILFLGVFIYSLITLLKTRRTKQQI
ncbi:uncharacterized protein B0J16DRAFT_315220 [Fusarium flagelliforme]|uniref:uncharacterized protein n=1 Tax=Fusarium flagelliforme TaxID=2675880 RepID=UPI001E8D21D8|nr:uncharacterized protein B0J16DRAFT_315220 [Fusarium flagelliforme]KAH7198931.1 hypothetical protein B0J16DRAFT_315220 [Fusarium flagelliforme]